LVAVLSFVRSFIDETMMSDADHIDPTSMSDAAVQVRLAYVQIDTTSPASAKDSPVDDTRASGNVLVGTQPEKDHAGQIQDHRRAQ
jgi:hypothetical protein